MHLASSMYVATRTECMRAVKKALSVVVNLMRKVSRTDKIPDKT